jgi:heptosyltransferase-3
MNAPRGALFIQLRRIGDVLMCTPSARAFKKHYPECRLDFLTEIPGVLDGNPHIDEVIAVEHSKEFNFSYQFDLIRSIRSKRYDLIVDFFASARSAYYSYLSGAEKRLSYGYGHRRWAYNLVPRKDERSVYAAADRLHLLGEIGVPADGLALNFYPSERDREEAGRLMSLYGKPVITISPVSRRPYRRWPLENFAALADLLAGQFDAAIIAVVGPGEKEFGDKLSGISKSNIKSICVNNLGLLGAIFEISSLHIGNDNGPKHIAVACGAPTVTIFGPDNPAGWTYPDAVRHQWAAPGKLCGDCRRKKNRCRGECIADISVETVWEKVILVADALADLRPVPKKS